MAAPLAPPTPSTLREAALAHLARYATSRANLVRVLDRRIARWARQQETPDPQAEKAARTIAREIVQALAAENLVDDAAFAEIRARRLVRAGRSRAAIAAHLAARGIGTEQARAALPEDTESELAAALLLARKRRIGPFRPGAPDPEGERRALAVLARAGFSQDIAERALGTDADTAEEKILRLRRG